MTVEKTEEVNQEQAEAERAAAIQAAFEEETARIAGVPEPEPKAADAQEAEPKAPAVEETQEVKEPSLAEQFAELRNENKQLRKLLDTTNGRFGQDMQHIKRRLERLPAQDASPNLNDVFSRLDIDDPAFADLKTEFPELGGLFVTALKKALVREEAIKEQAAAEVKATTTEKEIQQEEPEAPLGSAAVERMALESLQTKHPDFLEVAKFDAKEVAPGMMSVKWEDPKFGAWLDEMPNEYRESILVGGAVEKPTADQILRIADIMTEYKAQREQESNEAPAEVKTQESKPKPKVDLQKAILPTSRQSNKVALTVEEQIEEAKNAELLRISRGY